MEKSPLDSCSIGEPVLEQIDPPLVQGTLNPIRLYDTRENSYRRIKVSANFYP